MDVRADGRTANELPEKAGPNGYRDSLTRLRDAQKIGRGPAYLRFVNRRLGRFCAAAAFQIGMTPNGVTVVSATFTFSGIALLAIATPSLLVGVGVTALLLVGFALDSADGQLARLRGGGSRVGEYLDHVVDAAKVSSIHLAVLLSLYHSGAIDNVWLLIPLGASVLACVAYFANQLYDQLARGTSRGTMSVKASLLLLPTDYGVLCMTFLLLGAIEAFLVAYTTLLALRLVILARALTKQYRGMQAIDRQGS